MIEIAKGVVKKEYERTSFYQILEIEYENGEIAKAINLLDSNKELDIGEYVLVNITAKKLNLGTGGYDFILPADKFFYPSKGHIMKLRYTPLQFSVLTEEEKNPELFNKVPYFNNMVIVVCELHSMVLPICVYLKERKNDLKICVILTDWGMLNAKLSSNLGFLKANGFVDYTITCQEAFNGDFECINEVDSLIFSQNLGADIVIIAPLPGIVGTGTRFGFSAFNAVNVIEDIYRFGGSAIFPIRVSKSDKRERHKFLSHHSLTMLSYVNSSVEIPIFKFEDQLFFNSTYKDLNNYRSKHKITVIEKIDEGIVIKYKDILKTMGKGFEDDNVYFLQLFAVGEYILNKKILRS